MGYIYSVLFTEVFGEKGQIKKKVILKTYDRYIHLLAVGKSLWADLSIYHPQDNLSAMILGQITDVTAHSACAD